MLYDPQNFLHSLCQWAAARATGSVVGMVQYGAINPPCPVTYCPNFGSAPWNLFLNDAAEGTSTADPYAVVRIYSATKERSNPKPTIGVQLATYGTGNVKPWFLANSLYRCFCLDNQERELRTVAIPGFRIADNSSDGTWVLVNAEVISQPCQVGPRDDRGRLKLVSNFDLGFYKSS